MRLDDQRESENVEDRRGGGLGGPIMLGGGGLGVIGVIIALLLGVNPAEILGGQGGADQAPATSTAGFQPGGTARPDDPLLHFSAKILGSTEDVWGQEFAKRGLHYREPVFVPYDGATQTACGTGQSAMGPFYCAGDHRVYVDLSFYRELRDRFGAPGDFAEAYVIAHEVGHHVQNLLGQTEQAAQAAQVYGQKGANGASVRVELQADCYAGVWANRANATQHILEEGDVDQGLAAAAAVGDDTLQKETRGRVMPDSFTHGSSAQRVRWFKRGLQQGRLEACDTFDSESL
jgi:predicted metalloprotease